MKIRRLQRGLLTHLVKRGRPIEREVIIAILGNDVKQYRANLPEEFAVEGNKAEEDFHKILPVSLCNQVLGKGNLPRIKIEP